MIYWGKVAAFGRFSIGLHWMLILWMVTWRARWFVTQNHLEGFGKGQVPLKKITLRRWLDETICLSLSVNQSDTRRVLSPAEPVGKSNLKRVEQIFQRESLRCSSLLFFQLIAPWYIYYTPDITDVITTASYTLREPRLDGFARSRDGTILFIQLPPRHKEPSNMDAIPRMLGWVRQLWICTWNISNKTVPAGECWEYASCFKDPCFHYRADPPFSWALSFW